MFIFRGAHVGQQHLIWRFAHHLPNYARESRITSWQPFKHAASITESLLRTDFFLQNLLAHPLQHALWLSPALSHNFRGTFAKISLFIDPGHQQGVHWRKSEDQGPCCLALAKPHFWKLGYCYSHSLVPFSCRTPGGSGWQPFTYNDYNTQLSRNFREIKFYFRELEKNFREGFQHNMHGFRN